MSPAIALNLLSEPLALRTESPSTPLATSEYVSLYHCGTVAAGEDQFRVVSRGEKWGAARLEKDRLSANFQGNPLWPQQVLQDYPRLSDFFCLTGAANEEVCLLPLTSTINRKLKELTGSSFRFRDLEGELSTRAYVDAFIDEKVLPMAPLEERDSIHDWSYHFITFLFPEYLENVRQNLLFIRAHLSRFKGRTNYVWNYYGHQVDEHGRMRGQGVCEEMSHVEAIYRQMAIALDVATAKFVQLMGLRRRGLLDKCQSEIAAVGVFCAGVSDEALAKILWLEPEPLRVGAGDKMDPMDYIDVCLNRWERRASDLKGPNMKNILGSVLNHTIKA